MLALDSRTTEDTVMVDLKRKLPPGVLLAADVARIFSEEALKKHRERESKRNGLNETRLAKGLKPWPVVPDFQPLKSETVLAYRRRYPDMPAPAGRIGQVPWWHAEQERPLRDWFNGRAGQDHGRGGWPAGRPRKKKT